MNCCVRGSLSKLNVDELRRGKTFNGWRMLALSLKLPPVSRNSEKGQATTLIIRHDKPSLLFLVHADENLQLKMYLL